MAAKSIDFNKWPRQTSQWTYKFSSFIPSLTVHAKQADFFKKVSRSYGGDLLTKRKGRSHGRPISTQHSMHFVLRSTQARGAWSFKRHERAIQKIIEKFATKNGVCVKSMANVGNHLHLHVQLTNRYTYRKFIRAITSAIMMSVTRTSRWNKAAIDQLRAQKKKFWDRRPFSRIVIGFKASLTMRDYVAINQLESGGFDRDQARFFVKWMNSG